MPWRSVLLLVLVLVAAGCAPEAPPPVRAQRTDIELRPETETFEAVVPRNATLETLLRDHALSSDLVQAAVESARSVFNPRQLRANRPYRLVRTLDGLLREFEYEIDADRFLRIANLDPATPSVLEAEVLSYEKETEVVSIAGRIDADHPSLVAAMDETGENIQLAMGLAEIFGGQIDFQSDLQQGDTFDVLFEKSTREGQFAGYGDILTARLSVEGREHLAFRYVNPDTGRAGYYDDEGRSLKRFLLKSPLRFEPRITSGFSRRRLHPVFRTYRPHLGVDYGAPAGSAVVAVADGVVVSAGWAGGGGNQVRIRHAGGLESYYLHLSRFGKGIRAGTRVTQNQVIGFVGATGTATAAHLDYRLRKNGVFVDPRREHSRMPPGEPIPATQLASFRDSRDDLLRRLSAPAPTAGRPAESDPVRAIH